MIGNCERCPLPKLVIRIKSARNRVEIANANIFASSSPTEAHPYKKESKTALKELHSAYAKYAEFMKFYKGFCDNCEYGA